MISLAMTAAEIAANSQFPPNLGYMACHFSPYGTGLSNLPEALPEGSMLLVNDRTPVQRHDPELIAQTLAQTAEENRCSRILLDLQRPGEALTEQIVHAILRQAPCPVGVSQPYGATLSCPLFLPPVPLTQLPEEYLAPWQDREIWLEAALDAMTITLTPQGSRTSPRPAPAAPLPHADGALYCHYSLELTQDQAVFTLHRTWEDLQALMERSSISCWIGLYQELGPYLTPSLPPDKP